MALLLFIVALLLGLVLLSCALVMWLAEVAMPPHCAMLVVGGVYLIIAGVIYCCTLRLTLLRWRRRLDIVYEVSAAVDALYRRLAMIVKKIVGDLL